MEMVQLLQQASFFIGMGLVAWGIVEARLDIRGRN